MSDREGTYGVEELARRAGVSRRTVRYYVQRGLLAPPLGVGRGDHYTEQHLTTLVRVRELQESGVSLDEIAARLQGGVVERKEPALPLQATWTRVELGSGVEVHVRGRRLTEDQIRRLEVAIEKVLGEAGT